MKGCRPLTIDEVKSVLSQTSNQRDKTLLTLGFSTGFRISELLSLTIADVADANGNILSHAYLRACNTKNGEGRSQIINPVSKAELSKLIGSLFEQGFSLDAPLFGGRKEQQRYPLTRQHGWRILKASFEKAGIYGRTGTHSLRKTFAARMWDALDKNLVEVQRALGHKDVGSTIAYLSFNQQKIDDAIMGLDL